MIIFSQEYDGESIIDLPEDIANACDESDVPQDEYGLQKGTFKVTVEWIEDELEEDEEPQVSQEYLEQLEWMKHREETYVGDNW